MSEEKEQRKKIAHSLTRKFRLVLLHENTFKEVGYFRVTRLNVIFGGAVAFLIVVGITWAVIAYSPVRELIPGYPDAKMRNSVIQNKIRLDSLEQELSYRDHYFANLNRIISGERPEDFINQIKENGDRTKSGLADGSSDPLISRKAGITASLTIPMQQNSQEIIKLDQIHFFSPVSGMVTNSFNPLNNHFGTDVVAGPNEVVKATLDGTVMMASWTLETGHVIQIQHKNNLISVYKHNAELLKKVGMRVKAGDAIAIIGNSGELTTGPHLHFEIWQNGTALNPEDFIVF